MRRTLKITAMLVLAALAMTFGMIACSENEAMAQEPQPEVPDGSDSPDEEETPGNGLRIPYTIPDNVGETLSEWINDNL